MARLHYVADIATAPKPTSAPFAPAPAAPAVDAAPSTPAPAGPGFFGLGGGSPFDVLRVFGGMFGGGAQEKEKPKPQEEEVDPDKVDAVVDGLITAEGLVDSSEAAIMAELRALSGSPAMIAAVSKKFEMLNGVTLEAYLAAKMGAFDQDYSREAEAILTGDKVQASVATLKTALQGSNDPDNRRDVVADVLMNLSPAERVKVRALYEAEGGYTLQDDINRRSSGDDETLLTELAGDKDTGSADLARAAALAIDQELDNVVDDTEDAAYEQAGKYLDAAWEQEKRTRGEMSPEEEKEAKQRYAEIFRQSVAVYYEKEFDGAQLFDELDEGAEREKMWYVLGGNEVGAAASDLELATGDLDDGTTEEKVFDALLDPDLSPLEVLDWWEKKYPQQGYDYQTQTAGGMLGEELAGAPALAPRIDDLMKRFRACSSDEERQALEAESRVVMAALAINYGFGKGDDGTDEAVAKQAVHGLTKEQIEEVALLSADPRRTPALVSTADGPVDTTSQEERDAAVQQLLARADGELGGKDHAAFTADVRFGGKTGSFEDSVAKEKYLWEQYGQQDWLDHFSAYTTDARSPWERMQVIHAEMGNAKEKKAADSLLFHQGGAMDQSAAHEGAAIDTAGMIGGVLASAFLGPEMAFIGEEIAAYLGFSAEAGAAVTGAAVTGAGTMAAKTGVGLSLGEVPELGDDAAGTLMSMGISGIMDGKLLDFLGDTGKVLLGGVANATADQAGGLLDGEALDPWSLVAGLMTSSVGGGAGHDGGATAAVLAKCLGMDPKLAAAIGGLLGSVISGGSPTDAAGSGLEGTLGVAGDQYAE